MLALRQSRAVWRSPLQEEPRENFGVNEQLQEVFKHPCFVVFFPVLDIFVLVVDILSLWPNLG